MAKMKPMYFKTSEEKYQQYDAMAEKLGLTKSAYLSMVCAIGHVAIDQRINPGDYLPVEALEKMLEMVAIMNEDVDDLLVKADAEKIVMNANSVMSSSEER